MLAPAQIGLLAGAGILAGGVNAIAGGGSLISFPALLAVGYPSVPANVTNTVALWPGYLGGAIGYRAELAGQRRRSIVFGATSIAGAVVGCVLLLVTPSRVFDSVVPGLILLACALLAAQPLVRKAVVRRGSPDGAGRAVLVHSGVFLGGVYGAYFGAGLGVMLLGILGIFLPDDLQRVNALRSVLSLIINTVALVAFALFGPVHWDAVAVMALASLAGGFGGARVARKLPPTVLRTMVVLFGLTVAVLLFLER
jgi:uncharacterized protein